MTHRSLHRRRRPRLPNSPRLRFKKKKKNSTTQAFASRATSAAAVPPTSLGATSAASRRSLEPRSPASSSRARSLSPVPRRGGSVAAAAFPFASASAFHQPPPPPSQAAVLEAVGVARGLASAECFEHFSGGSVVEAAAKLSAPPLVDRGGSEKVDAHSVLARRLSSHSLSSSSSRSLSPASSASAAALASCLVTPVTEEENAGEAAREQLRRSAEETELEVSQRFAREIATREALTPAGVSSAEGRERGRVSSTARFSTDVAPAPGSGSRGGNGGGSSRRRGSRGGGGDSAADPLSVLLIALGAPAPPEVVSTINRRDVQVEEKWEKTVEEQEEEPLAPSAPSPPLALIADDADREEERDLPLLPTSTSSLLPRVDTLPPALDNERPETMASLAQLAMALDGVHASAAANILSLDEDFAAAVGNGGGGSLGRPLASLGSGVAGASTLGSNDFDDDLDDAESDGEKGEVLRFLGGRSNVVAAGVGSSNNNGRYKNFGSTFSVISSATLVAAASGAAPSPWLTLEEEQEAAAAAAAAQGEKREAVGV